jgi:hypothetical protein
MENNEYVHMILNINKNLRDQLEKMYKLIRLKVKVDFSFDKEKYLYITT